MFKVLFVIETDSSELLADAMIGEGMNVSKLYLSAELKDFNSLVVDEVMPVYDFVVVDGVNSALLEHSLFLKNIQAVALLYTTAEEEINNWLKSKNYLFVEIKNDEGKKKKDWSQAGVLFKEWLSESFIGGTNL